MTREVNKSSSNGVEGSPCRTDSDLQVFSNWQREPLDIRTFPNSGMGRSRDFTVVTLDLLQVLVADQVLVLYPSLFVPLLLLPIILKKHCSFYLVKEKDETAG